MILYDDFQKLDLRIAKILEAERIDGSEKLLKLLVDLGEEKRQIVAGIGKVYLPENLIGRQIVVIVNLEPRVLFGVESNGMLLAASDKGGNPVLLMPDKDIFPGAKIK